MGLIETVTGYLFNSSFFNVAGPVYLEYEEQKSIRIFSFNSDCSFYT